MMSRSVGGEFPEVLAADLLLAGFAPWLLARATAGMAGVWAVLR
jgi:hypothetical protein